MRHVKLFEEFINEFNYGKKLFADPVYQHSIGYPVHSRMGPFIHKYLKNLHKEMDEEDTVQRAGQIIGQIIV